MKKKLLSLALALVICLSLSVSAFAAETLTGNQLNPAGGWGNGPSLTLTGVVAERPTEMDFPVCYDVEVGGSLILEMPYPSNTNRQYTVMVAGTYVSPDFKEYLDNGQHWDVPKESEGGLFDASSGKTQYVYRFTEADMGQLNGCNKVIYPMISWDEAKDPNADYADDSGHVYFGIRVVPAKSAASAGIGGFTDVPASSPYADGIAWAVEQGITNGITTTTFGPRNTCTTSHILTFLYRAAGSPNKGSNERTAVTAWANSLGIDTSDLNASCTRAAAVTYMWKAAGSPATSGAPAFSDVSAAADYAQAVAWAVNKGITNGTSATTFAPGNICTRGQIATFLYRADGK